MEQAFPHPPPQRRAIRFETIDEVISEARRIAAAEREGRVRRTGMWTVGQNFGHVAAWIGYCFDGYPIAAPEEMIARARARLAVVLEKGMLGGVRIAGVEGGTAGIEEMSLEEGLTRLVAGFERLQRETPTQAHVVFGELSREDWVKLHLRHAELHFSYLHVQEQVRENVHQVAPSTVLRVVRTRAYADCLRAYRVVVDGRELGQIRSGETREFTIATGPHTFCARVDWCGSPTIPFTAYADRPVCFEIGSSMRGWRFFAAIVYVLAAPNQYLRARQAASGPAGNAA